MKFLPELVPISDVRFDQSAMLKRLADGPIVLIQRGRAAAVLMSPDAYNQLLAELEDYQDVCAIEEALQEQGHDPVTPLKEFINEMKGHASSTASKAENK